MDDYSSAAYGDQVAEFYDAWFSEWLDSADAVGRLAELGGSGPVLELGIGTGRVALPLLERGIAVHGIDGSEAMVARLRAKPGGDRIPVTIGDFSELPVDGSFSLVFAAAGTFFELQSQEAQVRCFANVARHLQPGGVFVIDALLPDATRYQGNQGMRMIRATPGNLVLQFRQLNPAEQRLESHYMMVSNHDLQLMSARFRYAWPGELDLMARMANLKLRERLGSWRGQPFTAESTHHVSIYELPE
ncbi:MAG: class I SAM-dependent DNA methyltransferase [Egibacteraceae bacterium]